MKARWINLGILSLALALRLFWLDLKPAHFDEGVNGWFVDKMTRDGFYHYDPTNFHGPLHFYVLFIAQTLLGRHEWALRLPIVLVSTACVGMLLLGFRRYFGERACQLAALAMAISPGYVFYGRYAIHETWMVLFLMITVWGLAEIWHRGTRNGPWAAGLGLAGMILTKETYVIHSAALILAGLTLWLLERVSPSAPWPRARPQWTPSDRWKVGAICGGAVLLIYSGFLLDIPWPGGRNAEGLPFPRGSICGLYEALIAWTHTGVKGDTGHEKPWPYWLQLLLRYEWPALLGLAASPAVLWPRTPRFLRWLVIATVGTLCAYSIVPYKTPWCLISIIWPCYLLFGLAVLWLAQRVDRWVVGGLTALLLTASLGASLVLNFRDYTKEEEPYVYVQTGPEIYRQLITPLRDLAARDPRNFYQRGYILLADSYPLPWLLHDYTQVSFTTLEQLPKDASAVEFFFVEEAAGGEIERLLHEPYFRAKFIFRGNSGTTQLLYLRASTFGSFLPGRTPEFVPTAGAADTPSPPAP